MEYIRQELTRKSVTLRQTHRAGEKLFADYAGQTRSVTDPISGKTILDRLVRNAYKINMTMKRESMRKKYAGLT